MPRSGDVIVIPDWLADAVMWTPEEPRQAALDALRGDYDFSLSGLIDRNEEEE